MPFQGLKRHYVSIEIIFEALALWLVNFVSLNPVDEDECNEQSGKQSFQSDYKCPNVWIDVAAHRLVLFNGFHE